MDNPETLSTLGAQDTGRTQSRDTVNTGSTRHRTKKIIEKNTHNTTKHNSTQHNTTRHRKTINRNHHQNNQVWAKVLANIWSNRNFTCNHRMPSGCRHVPDIINVLCIINIVGVHKNNILKFYLSVCLKDYDLLFKYV